MFGFLSLIRVAAGALMFVGILALITPGTRDIAMAMIVGSFILTFSAILLNQ